LGRLGTLNILSIKLEREGKMTEKEFWGFLEQRGKTNMILVNIASGDVAMDVAGEFISGHALLPKDYDNLTEEEIESISGLLFQKNIEQKTKEAILILLAHQISDVALTSLTKFNFNPDKELIHFARFALDESLMWNE
jgi:hypothetical protein